MSQKVKLELEFPIHASPTLLYNYISTPSGMSEWFADNVNSRGEYFRFIWDGTEEKAKILARKPNEKVRFRWDADEGEAYFFELRISVDDLTKDVSLIITDFSEEGEEDETKLFWENQISELKHILGAV
ncbi:MAG: START-like domain-containing protein [Flavobacteriaceae bacterium]|nr:START-like domain-containing protein [Flavobacteriaceae bacterium]